jgi:hypothetical protein
MCTMEADHRTRKRGSTNRPGTRSFDHNVTSPPYVLSRARRGVGLARFRFNRFGAQCQTGPSVALPGLAPSLMFPNPTQR